MSLHALAAVTAVMVGCVTSHDAARHVCTDEDRGVGAAWSFQAPPLSPCFKGTGIDVGAGERGAPGSPGCALT